MSKREFMLCLVGLTLITVVATRLPGCSRRDGRVAVSGEVTIDGTSLESGSIRFQPVDINKATGSGVIVRNGRYSVPADHGLTPGRISR